MVPVYVHVASASPHETRLVRPALDQTFISHPPEDLMSDYSLRQRFFGSATPTGLWYRSHRTLIRGMARKPGPRKGELCGATAGAGKSNVSLPDTIFRRLVSRWEIP